MMNGISLPDVSIKKSDLLTVLRDNQASHVEEYKEAIVGYKIAYMQKIMAMRIIVEEKSPEDYIQHVEMPPPRNFSEEYERAISMLSMCTEQEIKLSAKQFDCFVLDNWSWTHDFKNITSVYNNSR